MKVDETEKVGFAVAPLLFTVDEYDMLYLQVTFLFKVPELQSYQLAFVDRVAHFAAAFGGSPVFFYFPDSQRILKGRDGAIQISCAYVQLIFCEPYGAALRI